MTIVHNQLFSCINLLKSFYFLILYFSELLFILALLVIFRYLVQNVDFSFAYRIVFTAGVLKFETLFSKVSVWINVLNFLFLFSNKMLVIIA